MQTLTLRNSILVALGITACVGTPDDGGDASNSGSDGSSTASSGSTTIVASTAAPGSGTAPESGTSTPSTAGEVSESDASSAGDSSSTTRTGGAAWSRKGARGRDVEVGHGGRGLRERRFVGGRILVQLGLGRRRADPAAGNRHAERIRGV